MVAIRPKHNFAMAMDESNSSLRSTVARRNADDETLSFGRNSDNMLSTRKTSPHRG
jgi:hypothetical protein